jgi:hypothetical protein
VRLGGMLVKVWLLFVLSNACQVCIDCGSVIGVYFWSALRCSSFLRRSRKCGGCCVFATLCCVAAVSSVTCSASALLTLFLFRVFVHLQDVTHAKMRRRIENPRILLLDCPLEYKKGESQVRDLWRVFYVVYCVCLLVPAYMSNCLNGESRVRVSGGGVAYIACAHSTERVPLAFAACIPCLSLCLCNAAPY